jgi:hypothetical protein
MSIEIKTVRFSLAVCDACNAQGPRVPESTQEAKEAAQKAGWWFRYWGSSAEPPFAICPTCRTRIAPEPPTANDADENIPPPV